MDGDRFVHVWHVHGMCMVPWHVWGCSACGVSGWWDLGACMCMQMHACCRLQLPARCRCLSLQGAEGPLRLRHSLHWSQVRRVIEDLRFYDAHGVAGVRHPATKQLSLPKKKK